jgi:hypothetical protein
MMPRPLLELEPGDGLLEALALLLVLDLAGHAALFRPGVSTKNRPAGTGRWS